MGSKDLPEMTPLEEASARAQTRIVVIDDCRVFTEKSKEQLNSDTDLFYAKNAREGLEVLRMCRSRGLTIDQLWLDHDLGASGTIMPVVEELCQASHAGSMYPVIQVIVLTSNGYAGDTMMRSLRRYNYQATRVLAEDYFTI
jgi:chemotaxis response regulator CheB